MQPIIPGFPVVKLSGPLTVAVLLHWGLFGSLSVQLYLYYLAFPNNRKFTKYLVYGVYIVEFVQTILVTHDTFSVFGYGFGDMDALTAMDFNWLTVPIMNAVVACVGQGFYAFRIFILSKSQIVPIFVSCLAITSFAAAITTGIYALEADSIIELNKKKTSISIGICTPDSQRFRLEGNLTEIVHGAENISLDAFLSVGNQILAGIILFLARRKLYKDVFSVPLHLSFVQKLGYVRTASVARLPCVISSSLSA